MKRIHIFVLLTIGAALLFAGCGYDRHEPTPEKGPQPLPHATHSIAELHKMYRSGGNLIAEPVVVRGVVATSDRKGNFYRSILIQDETGGIELKMGLVNMYLFFQEGHEVAVRCQGLTLGKYGEVVNLGWRSLEDKYENGFVPERLVTKYVQAGPYVGIEPKTLTIEQLDKQYCNMLVRLERVQFLQSQLSQTYADAANKESIPAVNRTLVDSNGKSVIVRTSSYAAFAGKQLPQGSGSVVALLTYFLSTPQLMIIDDVRDVQLTNPRF